MARILITPRMTPTDGILRPEASPEVRQSQGSPDALKLDTLPPVAQLRVDTCTKVGEILKVGEKRAVCDDTVTKIAETQNEIELIAKIKKFPHYAGSKLESVVNAGKLEIKQVP